MGAGSYSKAIDLYTQAIDLLPEVGDSTRAWPLFGNRALCYFKLFKYEEAKSDAEQAISNNSAYAKGYYRLASCQLQLKDLAGAWESITKAVSLDPDDPSIRALEEKVEKLGRGELTS